MAPYSFENCVNLVAKGEIEEALKLLLNFLLNMREIDNNYVPWNELVKRTAVLSGRYYVIKDQKDFITIDDYVRNLNIINSAYLELVRVVESTQLERNKPVLNEDFLVDGKIPIVLVVSPDTPVSETLEDIREIIGTEEDLPYRIFNNNYIKKLKQGFFRLVQRSPSQSREK